ncbi:hypothetical protein [Kutzneria sp. 744]|uniref:hypothetical protein n=1 Tax=Kutzneria sp. (strain 744) TaxID=345341 RepID=UPI0003EECAC9|nr:hypothetical protein [Kutzneria sp. 744]EWM15224.1 hypothetical protein KUTG_05528 [Kutzneria sp. 744]
MNGVGSTWRPDGPVRYRRDGINRLVGVMPATCKQGLHALHVVGYTARETTSEHGSQELLAITCAACVSANLSGATWYLVRTQPRPELAELDDEPYRDIEPQLMERPVTR